MATPLHKNPCPGGHEIYKFGRPPLVIITIHLVYMDYALDQSRKNFKKYINFTLFTPKLSPLGERGHKIYNFLSSYPTDAKFGQY